MEDPQVTMAFNTDKWSFMTWMIWMIWGYPHDLGNLHCVQINDQKCGWPSTRPLPLSNHQAGCSPNLNATWLCLKIGCIVPKWIQLAILIAGHINRRISGYCFFSQKYKGINIWLMVIVVVGNLYVVNDN